MNTFKTLITLSRMTSKANYLNYITNELATTNQTLTNAGYNINTNVGLIGRQSFNNINDMMNFEYFREVHYIYHGLTSDNWNFDPIDRLFYIGLKGFVENQYNSLP